MITVQHKPTPLTAWQLTDQSIMLECLSYLTGLGWRGGINYNAVTDSWRIELNADDPIRQVTAETGDWLVLDVGLRKLTDQEFSDNYDEVAE